MTEQMVAMRPWRVTPVGLTFERDLTDREYHDLGQHLGGMVSGLQWAIGDWIVYGRARGVFGESYDAAAEITGRSHESLSQAARVAEAFPPHERVRGVSWTWHREALRLPPHQRVEMLQRGKDQRWPKMTLIGHINNATKLNHQRALAAGGPVSPSVLKGRVWREQVAKQRVHCPSCGHGFQLKRVAQTSDGEVSS